MLALGSQGSVWEFLRLVIEGLWEKAKVRNPEAKVPSKPNKREYFLSRGGDIHGGNKAFTV